jgi:hypothetical protein
MKCCLYHGANRSRPAADGSVAAKGREESGAEANGLEAARRRRWRTFDREHRVADGLDDDAAADREREAVARLQNVIPRIGGARHPESPGRTVQSLAGARNGDSDDLAISQEAFSEHGGNPCVHPED